MNDGIYVTSDDDPVVKAQGSKFSIRRYISMYAETNERMVKAQELSMLVDTSIQAITNWYRWKEEHPDHELAKWLPEYTQLPGGRRTRVHRYG